MKHLLIDTSNLLFRVAAAHQRYGHGQAEDTPGLAMHTALNTIKSYYKKVRPDRVAVAFEGASNWRKEYTRSELCVSRRIYKANRVRDDSMIPFFELIRSFEQLARQHTSLICLGHPRLEGDDVIAGYCQRFSALGDEVVILSGDKDFIQLLGLKGVTLLNPETGQPRELDADGHPIDPAYFIFEKCLRGDAGDNVIPAYPRVRKTRIKAAWENEYERNNMMNVTWEFADPATGETRTFRVGDLFLENQLLMDLSRQPEEIRQLIEQTIDEEVARHGQFSLFHFQKFCGKYGLKKIGEDVSSFIELFSLASPGPRASEGTKVVTGPRKRAASSLVF